MQPSRLALSLAGLLLAVSPLAAANAAPAGATWADFAIGTNFDVKVEHVTQLTFPPGRKPTTDTGLEHWTLVRKDGQSAVFAVVVGDKKLENTLPLALDPPPDEGNMASAPDDHRKTGVTHETIETPLGKLDCILITRQHSMNEADGRELEWRAADYPCPVKTTSKWSHKEQEDTETRTVIRFERGM